MSQAARDPAASPFAVYADGTDACGGTRSSESFALASMDESAVAQQHRKFRALLEEVTRLVGGDPGRPDWSPEDGVELLRALVGDPSDLRLVSAEKRAVARALRSTRWNIRAAARKLQIGKTTLYRKIRDFDISED